MLVIALAVRVQYDGGKASLSGQVSLFVSFHGEAFRLYRQPRLSVDLEVPTLGPQTLMLNMRGKYQ
jgi:hypothetical protein